jgi:P pilus assembly chaperone PapD
MIGKKMKKLLLFFGIIIAKPALAGYSVTPLSHTIDLDSKSRTRTFTIENPSKNDILVELNLFERKHKTLESDQMEKILSKQERKLLKIYPKLVKVKPNQKKSVVVKWIGDPNLKEGKLYTIIASQRDIKKDTKKAGAVIKFMLDYQLNIMVNPKKLVKKVSIDSYEYLSSKKQFKLTFKNEGNAPVSTTSLSLMLRKQNGETVTKKESFTKKELSGFVGKLIYPGKARTSYLDAPKEFQENDVKVSLFE